MSTFTDALCSAPAGGKGMVCGDPRALTRVPWTQVHERALRGAARLMADDLAVGEAVAVLAGSPADVAPLVQSIWLAGGSVTMLHQPTARTDLSTYATSTAAILGVIGARRVLLAAPFTDLVDTLAAVGVTGVVIDDLLAEDAPPAALPSVPEDSPALLQLTSGSTATPKAVYVTHSQLWENMNSMAERAGLTTDSVQVSWLPLFHDMGMVGFLTVPMAFGIEVVTVAPTDFVRDPLLWFRLISDYRGTHTAAPNFAYALANRVLPRAEGLDLSSLVFALNGAEPNDVAVIRKFLEVGAAHGLPSTAMVPAYGMAEATLGVSIQGLGEGLLIDRIDGAALENEKRAVPVSDGDYREFPALGRALRGIEIQVRDDEGNVHGDREVGVLFVRGHAVTDKYLTVDGPVTTKDAEGWLDTGDVGYLIGDQVVVCGRVKELIIMGGRNILPTDVERLAATVEGVRAGNAVAVRTTTAGGRESFAVAVESRLADDADEVARMSKEIQAAVTAGLGVRPAAVSVVAPGTLPKTPSGKLQRAAARALFSG